MIWETVRVSQKYKYMTFLLLFWIFSYLNMCRLRNYFCFWCSFKTDPPQSKLLLGDFCHFRTLRHKIDKEKCTYVYRLIQTTFQDYLQPKRKVGMHCLHFSLSYYETGTAGGPGGRDRTLAVKSRKTSEKSPFFLNKIKFTQFFFCI